MKAKISLLEGAKVVEPTKPAPPPTPPPTGTAPVWYAEVLARFPGDREARQWLIEQIGASIAWGGDNCNVRIQLDTLLAILKECHDRAR